MSKELKPCAPGKVRNPTTNRCVKAIEKIVSQLSGKKSPKSKASKAKASKAKASKSPKAKAVKASKSPKAKAVKASKSPKAVKAVKAVKSPAQNSPLQRQLAVFNDTLPVNNKQLESLRFKGHSFVNIWERIKTQCKKDYDYMLHISAWPKHAYYIPSKDMLVFLARVQSDKKKDCKDIIGFEVKFNKYSDFVVNKSVPILMCDVAGKSKQEKAVMQKKLARVIHNEYDGEAVKIFA